MIGSFWYAVATLTGTIVGVGVFGLPYVAWKTGFWLEAAYLAAFLFIFISLHLMFGEVILRTKERHRLAGYAKMYLGNYPNKFIILTTVLGVTGAMLLYILVGGTFLGVLFNGALGNLVFAEIIFWAVCSFPVFFGLGMIKRSEFAMLVFMAVVILVLALGGWSRIQFDGFSGADWRYFFLPYGVTLFALAGNAAIPAVREILEGSESKIKKAIMTGTVIPAIFYVLFIVLVLGVSGNGVSEDAISGLKSAMGDYIIWMGAAFGVLTVATSYITFAIYLKDTLIYDLKMSARSAILFVFLAPIILALVRSNGIVETLGFLGAIFGGLEAIFLIFVFRKARLKGDRTPEYSFRVPAVCLAALFLIFAAGIFYTIFFDGRL